METETSSRQPAVSLRQDSACRAARPLTDAQVLGAVFTDATKLGLTAGQLYAAAGYKLEFVKDDDPENFFRDAQTLKRLIGRT